MIVVRLSAVLYLVPTLFSPEQMWNDILTDRAQPLSADEFKEMQQALEQQG